MRGLLLKTLMLAALLPSATGRAANVIPLDGKWRFSLGEKPSYNLWIDLPGTTDMAGYGKDSPYPDMDNQYTFGWRRPKVYEGVAWYSRTVDIPEDWRGKHIVLFLEQTRSTTAIWVDGEAVPGTEESLTTAHRHDLSAFLTPGRHTLAMRLDNSDKHGIGGSYIRSAMGQGNWQGVTGRIELRMTPPVYIENAVFTPEDARRASVRLSLGGNPKGKLLTEAAILDGGKTLKSARSDGENIVLDISGLELWDEFNPRCYTLRTSVKSASGTHVREERIGIRFVGTNSSHQFTVNGRPIFLRGTVNYNTFPLTGYPPAGVEEWERLFAVYKEWGMNHVRFHSLTPPEAALEAADRAGIYLQCEAPKAGRCGKPDEDAFQIEEGRRLIRDYGNHPSWIMMSMGNELAGETDAIQRVLDSVREGDGRRLYTSTTGNSRQELKDDFKIYGGIVRGFKGPYTDWDYRETAKGIDRTMLSHEVGQWHVYPDISQIEKYTGVMKCDNLSIIREDLREKGLLDRAADFTRTTGKVSALLYKEEIEAIERTPDYGGFQILILNDFPAQGTASSGMIDLFNEPKGYLESSTFREYCAPVIPLLRLPKRTFSSSETLSAGVDLFCYLPEDLKDARLDWKISDGDRVLDSGTIACGDVKTGNVHHVGRIVSAFSYIKEAARLELSIEVARTSYRNRWNIWVYPDSASEQLPSGVHLAQGWDDARKHLLAGEKVLFFPSTDEMVKWRPGQFKTVFWSPVWLKRGPETMSVAAQTGHPALGGFPTERHTDWQWFEVLEHSVALCIDDLPRDFTPIVGVIDSFRKNERLCNLLEARVGKGRLLLASCDLIKDVEGDLARKALRNSIFRYISSDAFNPSCTLAPRDLDRLFRSAIKRTDKKPGGPFSLDVSADGKTSVAEKGYSLKVKSKIQKSGDISAWADKRDLAFTVTVPRGVSGTVSLNMRNSKSSRWGMLKTPQEIAEVDWVEETFENYGNKLPSAGIFVNGRDIGTISRFGSGGSWYSFDISPAQTEKGKVEICISTFNFPNILCELCFVAGPQG